MPKLSRSAANYPNIVLEITTSNDPIDLAAGEFDAGIQMLLLSPRRSSAFFSFESLTEGRNEAGCVRLWNDVRCRQSMQPPRVARWLRPHGLNAAGATTIACTAAEGSAGD